MTRRRLPIGMQTFREIREEDGYYVDKTPYIFRLVDEGKHYFLSRPRRFGKSLLLDTLKELFEGNESLFEGLDIHDRWDWSVRRPVVRLDFGAGHFREPGYLHTNVMVQLASVAEQAGVDTRHDTSPGAFRAPDQGIARTYGAVGGGADRRVRQADSGRVGYAGHRPREPRLPAGPLRGHQVLATPTSGFPFSPVSANSRR